MYRLNHDTRIEPPYRPCTVFDMIGGVGSGGFIAILLVIFGLTAEEASEEFANLSVNILDNHALDVETRTAALRKYVDDLLAKYKIDETTRLLDANDRSKGCKLAVVISYKNHVGSICILRNYSSRQDQTPNLTITEAVLATLAIPPFFNSTQVLKNASTFDYIGADWTLSNPTQEIVAEAHESFGAEEKVACLLSLGCGHAGIFATPETSAISEWNRLLERLAMDGERKAESIGSQMGRLGLYHRFNVRGGLERAGRMANMMNPGVIMQHTQAYLGELQVSQQIEVCTNALRLRIPVASLDQLRYLGVRKSLSPQLPPLTKTFVMRKEPWEFIEKVLLSERGISDIDGPRMLLVTGIGGCGKTQLMLRFMKEYKSRFIYQFFIDGSSEDRIRSDIVRNVRALGAEHSQKAFEDCLLFLSQPSRDGLSLLLYDNVDDPNLDLSSLLPRGNSCAIAITSRNHVLGELDPEVHLPLGIMSVEEAMELLLHGANSSAPVTDQIRKDTATLAEALGYLPIALQQACAYMRQTKCSVSAYLARLSGSKAKLLSQKVKYQVDMQSISTYAAFEMSFGRLPVTSQRFLRLLSYFHWAGFPLELINQAVQYSFSDYEQTPVQHGDSFFVGKQLLEVIFLRDGEWEATNLDEMIISLQNYSMVTLTHGVGTILVQMHPLAHEWVRECTPKTEKHEYQCGAILLLALGARSERTASTQYLASHVLHMTCLWNGLYVNDTIAFGLILHRNGIYYEALRLREAAAKELRSCLDKKDRALSDFLWSLSRTLSALGQMEAAKKLQEEVVKMMKDVLGERHSDTIMASGSLAVTYRYLGRLHEANVLQEEVVRLSKEILGDRHRKTLMASSNLAATYHDSGRLHEAELLQEEVLKWRKKILGERHPDTIVAATNLAVTYASLGRLKEAEVLQELMVKLRKEIMGERHPDTIKALNDLAITYCGLGKLNEAQVLQADVLKLRKKILGKRHPETIMASNNLAVTYLSLGRFHEAEVLQEEGLKLMKEILGERHPDTIKASINLALTYHSSGRLKEIDFLLEEGLALSKEVLGERHPDTIKASSNLASAYRDLGRLNEAEEIQKEVLRLSKEILGEMHPNTLAASEDLRITLHRLQRPKEAEGHQMNDSLQPSSFPSAGFNSNLISASTDATQLLNNDSITSSK
ncbi:hypothetical protein M408DRAFT_311186 [Serendipita vermifera MAFF 305830]|uniref:PNPLA domain-containing protein n=1 Tax=Serendipita vermifera MAFF 305830 TaxID=933852 RepID=A0A0C2XDY6_SERVB|nr:hypothetical protein M408DRAFT_311186 [Serendipita vermifera MAFF 305830]